jgi:hypothetical protein
MGILDDAIREHLELIRRHGATDSEVRRLEDEAFGPPSRPDEADFPESEEGALSGNGVAIEEPPEDAAAHEDVTTLLPAEGPGEPSEEPPGTGLEEPTGAHITGEVEEREEEPVFGEPGEERAGEVEPEEPIAEEHAILAEPPSEGEEPPSEEAPVEAEEAPTFFDQGAEEAMDLDLESPEEEEAPPEPPSEEHPADQPEGAVPLEPPIESRETVEHPFPNEIAESEEGEEDTASDEHPGSEEEHAEGEEASSEQGEDVLADTPDFLKDQPEDDELWFEQGEPKDFDF